MTSYEAAFLDGYRAQKINVYLEIEGKSLFIINQVSKHPLASWQLKQIYLQDAFEPGQPLRLTHPNADLATLIIEEDQTFYWLNNNIPGLLKQHEYRAEWKKTLSYSLVSLFVLIGAYFLFPIAAQSMVGLIPVSWEKEAFQDIHLQAAQSMGGDQICTGQDGQEVLADLSNKLWGTSVKDEVSVHVVKSRQVNAFATPGQHVIILSGLLDKAESSSEVAGVLAHELGHVHHRHAMQGLLRASSLTVLMALFSGGLDLGGLSLLAEFSYSRDHEREADQYALSALKRTGITSEGMANFFERLAQKQGSHESVMLLMSTHPLSAERAASLRAEYGGIEALSFEEWDALRSICRQTQAISLMK